MNFKVTTCPSFPCAGAVLVEPDAPSLLLPSEHAVVSNEQNTTAEMILSFFI